MAQVPEVPGCRKRGERHRDMLRFYQISAEQGSAWPVHRYSSKVEKALVVAKLIYEQGGCG